MVKRVDPVSIGPYTFDHASYQPDVDTLYLSIGPLGRSQVSEQTPEGHVLDFDEQSDLVGIEVMRANWHLERDGKLIVTLPVPKELEVELGTVEGLIAAAA
jgi:uncharacterized protein YuzE